MRSWGHCVPHFLAREVGKEMSGSQPTHSAFVFVLEKPKTSWSADLGQDKSGLCGGLPRCGSRSLARLSFDRVFYTSSLSYETIYLEFPLPKWSLVLLCKRKWISIVGFCFSSLEKRKLEGLFFWLFLFFCFVFVFFEMWMWFLKR